MIEYRPFDGDAEEMARFIERVWLGAYRGRAIIPVWDPSFFEWTLLGDGFVDRRWLASAYDERRLVGCLFAEPLLFQHQGNCFHAAMASWLSVDADYVGHGIGRGMAEMLRRVMIEDDCRFLLGFGMPGVANAGTHFWSQFGSTNLGAPVHLFTFPLVASTLARNETIPVHRAGAALLNVVRGGREWHPSRRLNVDDVRAYRATDLSECLTLIQAEASKADLSYKWDNRRLARQLEYKGVPRTLVATKAEKITAFVNSFPLTIFGRGPIKASFVDHVVFGDLPRGERDVVLRAAVADIAATGAEVVVTSVMSGARRSTLLRGGFVPLWPGYRPIFFGATPASLPEPARKMRVHFR